MTRLAWASVILAPATLILFVPSATYLFLIVTRRLPRPGLTRAIATFEGGRPEATLGEVIMALFFATLSQFLATVLVLDGLGRDPIALIAVVAGVAEWCAAAAWVGALVIGSSPPTPSGPGR